MPLLDATAEAALTATGQLILDARRARSPRRHRANDRAVDHLHRAKPFESERERVEHLFTVYETMRAPLTSG
ncbi:MAG: type IIL restriction-modification enzyme MmeI [Hyphomonadaceae bacterium]